MLTVAEAGRRGGKARLKSMTPEARQEVARLGGNATSKKLNQKRRKEIAQGAAQARWKAHKKVKP